MINGQFADGLTSRVVSATLHLDEDNLITVRSENSVLLQQPVRHIEVSSRLGNTPRTLTFATGETFETEDNDAVDALFAPFAPQGLLHRLESNLLLVVAAIVITIGVMTWAVVVLIPNGANQLAKALPASIVQEMGAQSMEILDRTMFEPSELDADRQQQVRTLLMTYLPEQQTTLYFRSAPPNAFALPDQSIVFTDGLVNLAETDEELIAIAFHELGHVEHRHLIRRSIQGSAIAILLFLVTGDVSNVDVLVTLPALLVDLAYSREFELEADAFALQKMKQQGIDPIHFINIMKRLDAWYTEEGNSGSESQFLQYLATHPDTAERLAVIEAFRASLASGQP